MPPDGEFALINYRTTRGFRPPFRLHTTMEADPISDNKATLTLRLYCEVRNVITYMKVRMEGMDKGMKC